METTGTVGYAAMFEQFHPTDLLRWSKVAEESGFTSVMASDHFHPWTPEQGQSAFVWSWLGALGATTSLRFGTGVTPPGFRYHPAIIAQAAATLESMYPGRFWLGLGAGEALNEHTVGAADEKIKMLMGKFEEGVRQEDKDPSAMPRMVQLHVSWAESQEEAEEQAVREWPNGGMPFPKADIRNPEDFAAMAKQVSIENLKNRVLTSADLDEHLEHIQHYIDLGFDEVYVHNVGRNQEEFIKAYGERVIPKLDWPEKG